MTPASQAPGRDPLAWGLVAALWAFYLVLVWVFRESAIAFIAPLGVVPIVATGFLLGPVPGLIGGLLAVVASLAIHALHGSGDPWPADVRENWFRYTVGIALGYGTGVLSWALHGQRRLARSLASQQRSWDTLLANAPDFVVVIDEQEKVSYANRTPAGLPPEAVLGQPIVAFVDNPAQRLALLTAIRQALSGGPASILELQGPGPHGRVSTYRCRILPTTEADGSRAALMLNVDITDDQEKERQLAERNAALERLTARLNEAQAVARVGSWEVDLAAGVVTLSAEAWRIWGFDGPPHAVPVAEFYARMHPDDVASLSATLRKALERGHDYERQLRLRTADPDRWRWVHSRGRISERDRDGAPVRVSGTVEDVTARHLAEQRLFASEARWRSLAENAPSHILTCDLEGRITSLNRAVPGIDPASLLGRPVWELATPGTDLELYKQRILDVARTGKPCAMEGPGPGPDGGVRWYATNWAPILEGGEVTGIISLSTDITEIRQAQQEREAAREAAAAAAAEQRRLQAMAEFRSQFLNNAAHELATPLTPLKLQLATLKASPLAKQDPAAFDLLERNLLRLGNLVNDLLDAARLQSGHFSMRPTPVVVPELLGRVAATFKAQARQAGITLGVKPHAERLVVPCDEMRVEQVLYNLVHNALKFTRRGGQVWLDAGADGQFAAIEVRDTGIGLTPAQAEALFQPFIQVHDAANLRAGGTGLGLYIARGIAQQHGGTLTVASRGPGEGATFTLRLPLTRPGDAASSAPATAATPPRADGGPGAPRRGP